jgi:hypothetical protein
MANQVEPGTTGGAMPDPGSRTRTAAGTGIAGYPTRSHDPAGYAVQPDLPYVGQAPGSPVAPHVPFHGRPVSWVAVSTIMIGFLVGGLALAFDHHGPKWWLFWVGVGLTAVGGLLALATGIFDDWY